MWALADANWVADEICAKMNPSDEMYCLCNTDYDIEMPTVSGGYSIDERKYVSDTDWQTKRPYKYVLQVGEYKDGNWDAYCTANMVRGKIVTASHCLDEEMRFRDGNGNEFSAHVYAEGDGVGAGDWVILEPDDNEDISQYSISKIKKSDKMGRLNVSLSGFGGLKVMNDVEIQRFQQVYAVWLKAVYPLVDYKDEGTVSVYKGQGLSFLFDMDMSLYCREAASNSMYKSIFEEYCLSEGKLKYSGFNYRACGLDFDDLFNDSDKLKTSTCSTDDVRKLNSGEAYITDCQSWGGGSGGGYYLSDDSILAIHTSGIGAIGDGGHASRKSKWGVFVDTIEDKLPVIGSGTSDVKDKDTEPKTDTEPKGDNGDTGGAYPKLLSKCNQDLPDNAVSGVWRADMDSKKICLGANNKKVSCTCGVWVCKDGYRRVGYELEAKCVKD